MDYMERGLPGARENPKQHAAYILGLTTARKLSRNTASSARRIPTPLGIAIIITTIVTITICITITINISINVSIILTIFLIAIILLLILPRERQPNSRMAKRSSAQRLRTHMNASCRAISIACMVAVASMQMITPVPEPLNGSNPSEACSCRELSNLQSGMPASSGVRHAAEDLSSECMGHTGGCNVGPVGCADVPDGSFGLCKDQRNLYAAQVKEADQGRAGQD